MASPRVRTRFAPSPTGFLHIGGVRSALYNKLLALNKDGVFILRIEDTDRSRFVPGSVEDICRSLAELGIVVDEGVRLDGNGSIIQDGAFGPYIQSERKEKHAAYADKLVEMGKAYVCFCTAERLEELRKTQQLMGKPTMYDGHCRTVSNDDAKSRIDAGEPHVIRLKLPREGTVIVRDAIRDEVEFEWKLIDDQVIIKSDGFPTYHLAAMCDDHDMEITHVVRGEEWLSSTPKHIFIYESFGWTLPQFAHLPLLLNPDHSKLSKRQGDVAAHDYLDKGYLPDAIINFIALLGWNPTGDQEIYSDAHGQDLIANLAKSFNLHKINKAGAIFNVMKLDWMNRRYIDSIPEEAYLQKAKDFLRYDFQNKDEKFIERIILMERNRIMRLTELLPSIEKYQVEPDYKAVSIALKQQTDEDVIDKLQIFKERISNWNDDVFTKDIITSVEFSEKDLREFVISQNWTNGEAFWPLRVALSGEEKSPSPFELLWALGKERSLARIDAAIKTLK